MGESNPLLVRFPDNFRKIYISGNRKLTHCSVLFKHDILFLIDSEYCKVGGSNRLNYIFFYFFSKEDKNNSELQSRVESSQVSRQSSFSID